MADWLGRLLDPYPTAPLFVCFLLLDAPALAPLSSTHHRQQVYLLVWCDLPLWRALVPFLNNLKLLIL
jgi:hypothetical protein